MCIANHPVLYDLHMKELEYACARPGFYLAKPVIAGGKAGHEEGAPKADYPGAISGAITTRGSDAVVIQSRPALLNNLLAFIKRGLRIEGLPA